ncbi:MAG: aminotransferase class V-fold PLP-dependent enzyme [Longimicrobiales bacterium]
MNPSSKPPNLLECQKDAFSLPEGQHYLNCAYMSPLPRLVEEAGIEGMLRKRNPALLEPADFFRESQEIRTLFSGLIHASDPNAIAILPSVSYGIGVAARNTPLESGQNVVLLHEQFPGNVYGWRRLAWERGAEVRTVGAGEGSHRGRRWNERVLESIDARTGVVALAPVHWTDGTAFDLAAIGARAREVGAALVVDGTQSVGALPLDVEVLQPDALIVAGYKWLLGPYSIGVGYFGPRYRDGIPLEETWIAREGSEDFRGLVEYRDGYQPGAIRFDVGERSNFILVPMLVAAFRLLQQWRPERIQAYTRWLAGPLLEGVQELGYAVEEDAFRVGHIFGIRMPWGVDLSHVKRALENEGVSASLRGSALRVSPHLYNDEGDTRALLRALRASVGG